MKRMTLATVLLTLLAGCVSDDVELPTNDASGSDKMKASPCACLELDYRAPAYEWRGRG